LSDEAVVAVRVEIVGEMGLIDCGGREETDDEMGVVVVILREGVGIVPDTVSLENVDEDDSRCCLHMVSLTGV
jgi:hypothetical protein